MRPITILLSVLVLEACAVTPAPAQSFGVGQVASASHSSSGGNAPIVYKDYYISPSGSDANTGTDAAHPWRHICPNVATLNANIPWHLHQTVSGNLGGSANYWVSGTCAGQGAGLELAYNLQCTPAKPCIISCDVANQGCQMDNSWTANNDISSYGFAIMGSSYVTIQGFEISSTNAGGANFSDYNDNILNDVRQFGFTTNGDTPVGSTSITFTQNPSTVPSGHYVYVDGSGPAPNTTVSGTCSSTACTLSTATLVDIPNASTVYFSPVKNAANHHIAFVNDRFDNSPKCGICGGARQINGQPLPTDYIIVTGSQVDDNLHGTTQNGAGIDYIDWANFDNAGGFHGIIGGSGQCVSWNTGVTCTGNWVYNNYICTPGAGSCAAAVSVAITDGECIILDSNNTVFGYTGAIQISNNVIFGCGANGIQVFRTINATVSYNTLWSNNQDGYLCSTPGEILFSGESAGAANIAAYNIAYATVNQTETTADQSTQCTNHGKGAGPNNVYAFVQQTTGAGDFLYASDSYNSASTNYRSVTSGITVDASNTAATNPGFASVPTLPLVGPVAAATMRSDFLPSASVLNINFTTFAGSAYDFLGNPRPVTGLTVGAIAQ